MTCLFMVRPKKEKALSGQNPSHQQPTFTHWWIVRYSFGQQSQVNYAGNGAFPARFRGSREGGAIPSLPPPLLVPCCTSVRGDGGLKSLCPPDSGLPGAVPAV